jgi:hypothetical protein
MIGQSFQALLNVIGQVQTKSGVRGPDLLRRQRLFFCRRVARLTKLLTTLDRFFKFVVKIHVRVENREK